MFPIPPWLSKRIPSLTRTGNLNLMNEKTFDFASLRAPDFASYLNVIKHLDIKGTSVTSLENMPDLPNLKSLNGDSSKITTLKGFSAIAGAQKVSLKHTPVSQYGSYKISLLIVCPDLVTIDNTIIPKSLRRKASEYPKVAVDLVNKGWMAETPCPDEARFNELCDRFGVDLVPPEPSNHDSMEEEIDEFADFEAVCQSFRDRQDQMFALAEETFGIVGPFNFDAELADSISMLFGNHGIAVDATNDDLIVQAIEDLCIKATTMDNRTPPSLSEDEA